MSKCKNCKYLDTVQNDLRSEPFKWCVCTDDSPVLDMERDCDYYVPMTNADRIRSMTDEELAEFIVNLENHFGEEYEGEQSCLSWLQKESEE
nr:MAG TPA: 50S ribosomal protein L10 [Bacteriophage sp.]